MLNQHSLEENLKKGKNLLIENIKILLYKERNDIFEFLDFENDDIYLEPLFFAYFNSKKQKETYLDMIIYGYIQSNLRPREINVISDDFGRIYLPKVGWFLTTKMNHTFKLHTNVDQEIKLESDGKDSFFKFEPIEKIDSTDIEYLKYPIPLLKECYFDVSKNLISVEIENISKKHFQNITKALNFIQQYVPKQFDLIRLATKKVVIFNVDTTLRNSFATLNAHGISFSNAYQPEYNEVFFIDDFAHQTGHIIFETLTYDISSFLKVPPNTVLEILELGNNTTETRNIHVIFHALYTYYTTLTCLDACLDAHIFDSKKTHEIFGRIYFYIRKCHNDLFLIETANIDNTITSINELFTNNGLEILFEIKTKFFYLKDKWENKLNSFNMANQPYNFTYSKFIELNPLNESPI